MVTRLNASLPVSVVKQGRSFTKSVVVVVALAAIAYLLISVARSLLGRVRISSKAKELYTEGGTAFDDKQYAKAIEKYTLALQSNPDQKLRAEICADRGLAKRLIGENADAVEDFKQALLGNFLDKDLRGILYLQKGIALADQDDHEAAIQDYNDALTDTPNGTEMRAEIFFQRALSRVNLQHYNEAMQDLTDADNCNSSDHNMRANILAGRAVVYKELNRPNEALQNFEKALECSPDDKNLRGRIHFNRAILYANAGNHSQAILDYNGALVSMPNGIEKQAEIIYRRGSSYAALEHWEEAIQDMTDAYACNPSDLNLRASILGLRGAIYSEQNNFNLCIIYMTAAIECKPSQDLDQYLLVRGLAFVKLNKFIEAIQDYTTAMDINPSDQEIRAQLLDCRGDAHHLNNNLLAARQDWEETLKCTFSKEGLRESIESKLKQEKPQPAGKVSTVFGWMKSKWKPDPTK